MAARARERAKADAARTFYEEALSEAERQAFGAALAVDGLDQEIAVLRLRLKAAIAKGDRSFELMLKGVDMLAKAVAARFKLAPGSEEQLARSLQRVLADMRGLEEERDDGRDG